MKLSARNQFEGTVTRLLEGAVNDEVEITAASGLRIVAIITSSSRSLGLTEGGKAVACVKAPSVIVATGAEGMRVSARNCFAGTVAELQSGAVNSEVTVDVGGGARIVAVVTRRSVEQLQLAVGQPATVLFKAPSVIVGALD